MPYPATNENLLAYALEPAMRWLIATALDGATMTYGEVGKKLENEANFSTIFATRIGFVAGELMHRIQRVEPNAPLINVLVVNQEHRTPGDGAGVFMARRFLDNRLNVDNCREEHPVIWRRRFGEAAAEVYAYSPGNWATLYERVFGATLQEAEITAERAKRQEGSEDDFGAGAEKYGTGGESEHHRALRLWVMANPNLVDRRFAAARTETEFCLDSGDRIDVIYHLASSTVIIEVKSRISNNVDFRRGVYQCIKYRAVKSAMDIRNNAPIKMILVTETEIPSEVSALLREHDIRHIQLSMNRD